MNINIRRPKICDKSEIHSLFERTIKYTFESEGAGSEHELIQELADDQKELIDLCLGTDGKEVYFLVAECDAKIVGTICFRPCSDIIIECSGGKAAGMTEIGSVYILPEFQRKGIVWLLLNAMYLTLAAKGFAQFWLDSGYENAKKVWKNILGEPTIIMKDYWGEGIAHHIWYRKVSEIKAEYRIP